MVGFSSLANDQVFAAGDGPNGHVPFVLFVGDQRGREFNLSCGEGDVEALRIISRLRDVMSAKYFLRRSVVNSGNVSAAVSVLLSMAVGVAMASRIVVLTPPATTVELRLEKLGLAVTLPPVLTTVSPLLLLLLLFIPLFALVFLLLVRGVEAAGFLNLAGTFVVQ